MHVLKGFAVKTTEFVKRILLYKMDPLQKQSLPQLSVAFHKPFPFIWLGKYTARLPYVNTQERHHQLLFLKEHREAEHCDPFIGNSTQT